MNKIDEYGKWKIYSEDVRVLIEPSEKYLEELELEEQKRLEMKSNKPPTLEEKISSLEEEVATLNYTLMMGGLI